MSTSRSVSGLTSDDLVIVARGLPAPQGSKRHVGHGVMVESSKAVKPWRETVKHAALDSILDAGWDDYPYGLDPLAIQIAFTMPRPRSHYRTGKHANQLRDDAPLHVNKKPDIDKLLRSTLDALGEAGVYRDDGQVAFIVASKRYGNVPGAEIVVQTLVVGT